MTCMPTAPYRQPNKDKKGSACSLLKNNFKTNYSIKMYDTFLASSNIQNELESCNRDGHHCSPNARCPETRDGYTCVCKPGYIGDGKTCK